MTRHPDHTAFTQAQQVAEIAQRITYYGAPEVLRCGLSDRERRQWENGARWYLNALHDGLEDEDEFAEMVDEFFNPARDATFALDADFLRDERAETPTWGMA